MRGVARGFALVETLVAIAVVAAALGGNYLLFTRTWQQHQHGVHHARAVVIARAAAAALDAAQVGPLADPVRCSSGDAAACAAIARADALTRTWRQRAARVLPASLLGVRRHPDGRVDVDVAWREPLSPTSSRYRLRVGPR